MVTLATMEMVEKCFQKQACLKSADRKKSAINYTEKLRVLLTAIESIFSYTAHSCNINIT